MILNLFQYWQHILAATVPIVLSVQGPTEVDLMVAWQAPPTRPVAGGNAGQNVHISELNSEIMGCRSN